ncbi:MAG: hypothetical protein U9N77_14730 [Thermodesulfobacteriota bacterium]|nr:hypothetical protein [Thermodesulfobacteriota bacterium]
MTQICKDFLINNYNSVNSIIGRVEERIQKDPGLKKTIQALTAIINQ